MFSICVQFLHGRVAATRPNDDKQLEWPIEPARLFMALVAAHYESDGDDESRRVLEWLEQLAPPEIVSPAVFPRTLCTNFVPVNDKAGDKTDPLGRSKQPRHFPSGFVGDEVAYYHFSDNVPANLITALEKLLASVVRIGHSSSLVRCWLSQESSDALSALESSCDRWLPRMKGTRNRDQNLTSDRQRMRIATAGALAMLDRQVNREAVDRYGDLCLLVDQAAKPAERKKAIAKRDEQFPAGLPTSQPIKIGTNAVYSKLEPVTSQNSVAKTIFEPTVIPLTLVDGNIMGLESTQLVCKMLRNAVLTAAGENAPTWLTGHDSDGASTRDPHLAIVPLAFVGDSVSVERFHVDELNGRVTKDKRNRKQSYADGHLLGLGLVIPAGLSDSDKSDGLSEMLFDELGEPKEISLTLGERGIVELRREERTNPPRALKPETWTKPSRVWATVTPIVLNRHPKTDRQSDRVGWEREVAEMIRQSCDHIGIGPASGVVIRSIRLGVHGFLSGVPSSRPQRGFRLLDHSDNKTRRMQTHAVIEFESPVQGPVLLGAGRFRGYGLCKPVGVQS